MPITVFGPPASPSAQALRAALATEDSTCVVCWGPSIPTPQGPTLNAMAKLSAVRQLEAFTRVGVPTIEWTQDLPTAKQWSAEGLLVWGRNLRHTRGNDIIGPGPAAPAKFNRLWERREFWVKVVRDVQQEWRIHIFRGLSIARGLKVQTAPPVRKQEVRNRTNGWTMIHTETPPKEVREAARAAVGAVGYDFGAVDVLLRKDGTPVVLECNAAPGLDNYTCAAYVESIIKFAKERQ